VPSAEERFGAKIRGRGDHDIWTGFTDHRGVGMVRIDGKLRTVQRAAWEFARGPLPDGVRVNSCAAKRACVRIEHLSISPTYPSWQRKRRAATRARGPGSKREIRAGVWQLVVTEGATSDGTAIRRYRTIRGDEHAAATELESLDAHVARDSLGDLRVRELLGRYLHAHHDHHSPASDRDQTIVDHHIDPAIGDDLAAFVTEADITSIVNHAHQQGGTEQARLTLGVIRDAYRWAHHQRWTTHDPTAGVTLRAGRRPRKSPQP
jgi:hypothetical protein